MAVSPRLHVLLGAGGVGKTTLAAGFAIALARSGARVGLLGIDPARRLQAALGVPLVDASAPVEGWQSESGTPAPARNAAERSDPPAQAIAGALDAAILRPADCLRHWAAESIPDPDTLDRLLRNTFFLALADRLAAASDVIAAIRLAEWAERDPAVTDLVIDTAPGLNAIDFLRRPKALTTFLEGRLVRWLRAIAPSGGGGAIGDVLRGGARRATLGLSRLGGTRLLLELGDFLALIEAMFELMLARLDRAQRWLHDPATQILLVTAVRDDAAEAAAKIADALHATGIAPRAAVLNRTLPDGLAAELDAIARDPAAVASLPREARVVATYARLYIDVQRRVAQSVSQLAPRLVILPSARGLDEDARLSALAALGERLRLGLRST